MLSVEVMDELESPTDLPDRPVVGAALPSFDGFFRDEYRRVLGLAVVLSGSRPVAEELTMDAFEAALRHWERVSRMDSPGAWVRKVLSNTAVSRFRRMAAEARAKTRLSSTPEYPVEPTENAEVWEAVRRLPRRQAQAITLFYVEGYSRMEIGQVLGISAESVKTHLERARRRLQQELGDDDG